MVLCPRLCTSRWTLRRTHRDHHSRSDLQLTKDGVVHITFSIITMDFEALAAECRSAAFRYVPQANGLDMQALYSICKATCASIRCIETHRTLLARTRRSPPSSESLRSPSYWTQAAEAIADCHQQLQTQIHAAASAPDADATSENDDGLGYTFRVDRKNPTPESLQDDFSPPAPVVADVERASSQVATVTAVFRFLRNACAACSDNQDACRDAGLLKLVSCGAHCEVLVCACCSDRSNCAYWYGKGTRHGDAMLPLGGCGGGGAQRVRDCGRLLARRWLVLKQCLLFNALKHRRVILLAQVALQFCVNCVTSNIKNQATVWELFFPDGFQVRRSFVDCKRYSRGSPDLHVPMHRNCWWSATSTARSWLLLRHSSSTASTPAVLQSWRKLQRAV
jgi:hypothetical protein